MESTDRNTIKPQPVTGADLAFGGDMRKLMVPYESIPEDFRRGRGDARKWVRIQQEWFFRGLKGATFQAKDGIDEKAALRHLAAIQGSFEPKHEHKEACVAYLLSQWFHDVKLPEPTP
jgi:hypothetical protein